MSGTFDDEDFADFVSMVRDRGLDGAASRWAQKNGQVQTDALRAEHDNRLANAKRGYPPKIFSLPDGDGWYVGPVETDKFWPALCGHLAKHTPMDADQIDLLDQASTKILAHTAYPERSAWDTRGLVVGFVQSGKTTNFTAVIAKAIDVGYNLVVVLSGIHNGLRRQTQERLQLQLCSSDPAGLVEMTTLDHDFVKPPHTLESVLPAPGTRKAVLCVVKKNTAPLRKLQKWLRDAKHSGGLSHVKALIIDDEADQASVATPRINPLIRGILEQLPRKTFIGYTATPFANVLIGTEVADDLYPKDFILNLPEPEGYFGPRMIFGRDELPGREGDEPVDGYDMVRDVPVEDAKALRPPKSGVFQPSLPDSLVAAVLWFWLATAARRARGDSGHSTMLLHTTMRTSVHDAFKAPILDLRSAVLTSLRDGRHTVTTHRDDGTERQWDLAAYWSEETARVDASDFDLEPIAFENVASRLEEVLDATTVILEHSKSLERLTYGSEPVTAIAVGGNTLSRGLTLEGLVVSYFIRAANAYDTLMQMGRWFGFRNGYEDLPRIFMTGELKKWFRHLAAVEEEIRLEIRSYEDNVMRPTDFGVRIRTHPQLLVTQKLGAARQAFTSYGGRRLQVRYFKHRDEAWLRRNVVAANALIHEADRSSEREDVAPGVSLWRNLPVAAVQTFLSEYEVHEDSPDMNRKMLLAYLEKELAANSLHRWSVAVVGGDPSSTTTAVTLGGHAFRSVVRSRLDDGDTDRADIKTLMSKEHRVVDLPLSPSDARKLSEEELMNKRQADETHRSRGLLLLYPIDPVSPPADDETNSRAPLDAAGEVLGLAVVFPGDKAEAVSNSYIAADVAASPVEEPEDPEEIDSLITVDTESDGVDGG